MWRLAWPSGYQRVHLASRDFRRQQKRKRPCTGASLRDRDPAQRQLAMWALARLGPEAEHVHAVAAMLDDKDEGVRSRAALNLGRMGPAAASAVPQLLTALHDEDQFVRIAAVRALGSICPQDDAVLAALSVALQDKSAMVRRRTLDTHE
jgi:hypothetical protein